MEHGFRLGQSSQRLLKKLPYYMAYATFPLSLGVGYDEYFVCPSGRPVGPYLGIA
jgi:hypothetical protein